MKSNFKTTIVVTLIVWSVAYSQELSTLMEFIQPALELEVDSSGLQGIDQIYVLNLDIRYQRWLNTQKALEAFRIFPKRVVGINGWKLNRKILKKLYKNCVDGGVYSSLTPGQLGCFLSHISILNDANLRGYRCIWVLEDDVLIVHNIRELPEVIARLDLFDPKWDILFTDINARGEWFEDIITFERIMGGGFDYSLVNDPLFIPQENEDFRRIQYRLCTHSMIISDRGIKKLLDYFQSIKIVFPIDIQMHCCPNKRFYVSKKEYVTNGVRETSDTSDRPHL